MLQYGLNQHLEVEGCRLENIRAASTPRVELYPHLVTYCYASNEERLTLAATVRKRRRPGSKST